MKSLNFLFKKTAEFTKQLNVFNCAVVLLFSFILASCNNLSSKFNRLPASNTLLTDGTTTSSGTFHITSLVPDPANLGTMYNVIGFGGEIGTNCSGAAACQCEYTFSQPGVGTQTVDVANTYYESDLIRCPTSGVPSGINSFDVKVITASGTFSNSITVSLNSNGTFASASNYIDLTNENSYLPVQRFQCHKREFIKNPLDNAIIDPFQSTDPRIIYPFNYYTSNVSDSLLQLQRIANQSWECSIIGTPSNALPSWSNPNVFSVTSCSTSFCSGDQELIYPQSVLSGGKIPVSNASATGKRRSSFYLANQSYGVFQVAVKAAVAPKDYVSGTYSTIGYAAKPIPNVNGSSSCPSITLPPKAIWVKLWNYRATDITAPQIVTGSQSVNQSTIACNTQTGDFGSCDTAVPNGTTFGQALTNINVTTAANAPAGGLASRVTLWSTGQASPQASACYNFHAAGALGGDLNAFFASQAETWYPSPYMFATGDKITKSDMIQSPWNMYATANSTTGVTLSTCNDGTYNWLDQNACGVGAYSIPTEKPFDSKTQLVTTTLSPSGANYTDQLFVVTDPSVDDNQMRNGSSSVSQYTPLTFRAATDCSSTTKDACTAIPIHWDINVKEVGSPTGLDVYPLCVIQFYD